MDERLLGDAAANYTHKLSLARGIRQIARVQGVPPRVTMATQLTHPDHVHTGVTVCSPDINTVQIRETMASISNEANLREVISSVANELDNVEAQLIEQVESNADCFYSAISDMENIGKRTVAVTETVEAITIAINSADQHLQSDSATGTELLRQEKSLLEAKNILHGILDILHQQHQVRILLDTHQFKDALDNVNKQLLAIDNQLVGIKSVDAIRTELQEMKTALEKMKTANVV